MPLLMQKHVKYINDDNKLVLFIVLWYKHFIVIIYYLNWLFIFMVWLKFMSVNDDNNLCIIIIILYYITLISLLPRLSLIQLLLA